MHPEISLVQPTFVWVATNALAACFIVCLLLFHRRTTTTLRRRCADLEAALSKRTARQQHDLAEFRPLEAALHQSETFIKEVLNSLSAHIAVLDTRGVIVAVNTAWRRFAEQNGGASALCQVGSDYLAVCRNALAGRDDADARAALSGIRAMLDGVRIPFSLEYPCHSPTQQRWFEMRVYPLSGDRVGVVVAHEDITARRQAEEALWASEAKLKSIFRAAPVGIGLVCNRVFVEANDMLCQMTGYSPQEMIGQSARLLYPTDQDYDHVGQEKYRQIAATGTGTVETRWRRKDGAIIEILLSSTPLDTGDLAKGVTFTALDITGRNQAENALRVALTKYKTLFDAFPLGITVTDPAGNIVEANPISERLLGIARAEHYQRDIDSSEWRIVRSDGTPMPAGEYASVRALRDQCLVENVEMGIVKPQEEITWLSVTAAPLPLEGYGVVITYGDITERKRMEEALRDSLEEKETLLREVHHRVKNNLTAIIGLLELQRGTLTDATSLALLSELGSRIRSMALVHEMLYQSKNLNQIDFQAYLRTLIGFLRDSFDPHGAIRLDVAAPEVGMDLDTAIPCGLIVNELVINALKYAFPERWPHPGASICEISVTAARDDVTYTLVVADNGVGLPADLDWTTTRTLGLRLVRMLGQHQLRGKLELDRAAGTRFSLRFDSIHHGGNAPDGQGNHPDRRG